MILFHPREDDRADLRNSWYLQRNLGGRVEMVVLEDSFHVITLDKQRDVVMQKSAAFARELLAQQASGKGKASARPVAAA